LFGIHAIFLRFQIIQVRSLSQDSSVIATISIAFSAFNLAVGLVRRALMFCVAKENDGMKMNTSTKMDTEVVPLTKAAASDAKPTSVHAIDVPVSDNVRLLFGVCELMFCFSECSCHSAGVRRASDIAGCRIDRRMIKLASFA